jgi:hypothetical protein
VLAVGILLSATIDWSSALDATGKRLIATILFVALFGVGAQRISESNPRVHVDSPDTIGLSRDFTLDEIDGAERSLGVTL